MFLVFLSACSISGKENDSYSIDLAYPQDIMASVEEINQFILKAEEQYPAFCKSHIIGYSSGPASYPIYALVLSENVQEEEKEPELLFTGGIHGDEEISTAICLFMIRDLLEGRINKEIEANRILKENELHFIPLINPDGLAQAARYNYNNVDLNRNFPWSWEVGSFHGSSALDQKESLAFAEYARENYHSLCINGHSGDFCIYTLWDYLPSQDFNFENDDYEEDFKRYYLPSFSVLMEMAQDYANQIQQKGEIYFTAIEGGDAAALHGTATDWIFAELAVPAFSLEYYPDKDFRVKDSQFILDNWDLHSDALYSLTQWPRKYCTGTVTKQNGEGMAAKVIFTPYLSSRAVGEAQEIELFVRTDPAFGDFWAMVPPGKYNCRVEAEDFLVLEKNIEIKVDEPLDLHFQLEKG